MIEFTRQQIFAAFGISESAIQRAVPSGQPISLVAAGYPS